MKLEFLVVLLCFCSESLQDGNLVLLNDAVEEGAVCLDGSAPGYYFRQGECCCKSVISIVISIAIRGPCNFLNEKLNNH